MMRAMKLKSTLDDYAILKTIIYQPRALGKHACYVLVEVTIFFYEFAL